MGFRYLDHTADIMFEAEHDSLEGLFHDAAQALLETMCDVNTVKPAKQFDVRLEHTDPEQLLFNFLEEIIFLKDAEGVLFCSVSIYLENTQLTATLFGDSVDPLTQTLRNDVKAVTLHEFILEKREDIWKTHVILDV